jgi:peptidoglycan/xylan/chitin deacetylase (PgdA/CDA1 family)
MNRVSLGLNRYHQSMHRKYPGVIWFGNPSCPEIALTFDDGPHGEDTPRVLDALARHDIRATFF